MNGIIMLEKLGEKDKRALKLGLILAVVILAASVLLGWIDRWKETRKSLAQVKQDLKAVASADAGQDNLLFAVPVFELPQNEEKQKSLFRDKISEQLKKAGIQSNPIQILPSSNTKRLAGYKLVSLKCTGKARFEQVLDLLAALKENPYLVGIEEFRIKCDPKKRQEFDLNLTVSTLVK